MNDPYPIRMPTRSLDRPVDLSKPGDAPENAPKAPAEGD